MNDITEFAYYKYSRSSASSDISGSSVVKLIVFTSSVRTLIRTSRPVSEKLGTMTIRQSFEECSPRSYFTSRVPNLFWQPTMYRSGVVGLMKGSLVKYG